MLGDGADWHFNATLDSMLDNEFDGLHDMHKYCPFCGSKMITKTGKYGKFRGCTSFPNCDFTEDYQRYGKIT